MNLFLELTFTAECLQIVSHTQQFFIELDLITLKFLVLFFKLVQTLLLLFKQPGHPLFLFVGSLQLLLNLSVRLFILLVLKVY